MVVVGICCCVVVGFISSEHSSVVEMRCTTRVIKVQCCLLVCTTSKRHTHTMECCYYTSGTGRSGTTC